MDLPVVATLIWMSYSGDIHGLPIVEYPSPAACEPAQKKFEEEHKSDVIIISACLPKGEKTIFIRLGSMSKDDEK